MLKREIRGNVGTLVFNPPERKNALSPEMLVKLHLTLKECAQMGTLRTVVLTGGRGKAFSSGYDILSIPTSLTEEEKEILRQDNPLQLALNTLKRGKIQTKFEDLRLPVMGARRMEEVRDAILSLERLEDLNLLFG